MALYLLLPCKTSSRKQAPPLLHIRVHPTHLVFLPPQPWQLTGHLRPVLHARAARDGDSHSLICFGPGKQSPVFVASEKGACGLQVWIHGVGGSCHRGSSPVGKRHRSHCCLVILAPVVQSLRQRPEAMYNSGDESMGVSWGKKVQTLLSVPIIITSLVCYSLISQLDYFISQTTMTVHQMTWRMPEIIISIPGMPYSS